MRGVVLAAWLTVVVDQVDQDVALVEWAPHVFGTVPTDVLPDDVSEGDRLQVRVRRRDLTIADAQHGGVLLGAPVRASRPVSTRADELPNSRRRP